MDETTEVAERHVDDGFIKDNKKTVHMGGEFRKLEAQSLIDATTDTIAADGGFKNFFRNNDTKTLMMVGIRCIN